MPRVRTIVGLPAPPATMAGDQAVRADEEPKLSRAAGLSVTRIQDTERDGTKVHGPAVDVDFFEADQFSREAVAQIPLRLAKRDDTIGVGALHTKVPRIFGVWELPRIGAERRLILRSWRRIAQRLVRPLVVVFLTKRVEASLLRAHAAARRPRRVSLQRTVHALVAAIL